VILVAVLFGALNAHKTWALLPDWPLPTSSGGQKTWNCTLSQLRRATAKR